MKKIPFKSLRHLLTTPAAKLVIFLAVITPRWLSRLNAKILGWFLSILPLPSNKVIQKHQQGIMKKNNIQTSTSQIYTSILIGFFDFFYLSYRSDETFKKLVQTEGAENMQEALAKGNGVIAITAHFGSWELLPRAMKILGFDLGVIGRSLKQKGVAQVLNNLREKPGIQTIDRNAGAAPIVRLLRQNRTLGMLIDQATKGVQNEQINFLGKPASTPVSPALFAKKLNTPIVTMHIEQNNDSTYLLIIDKPFFPKPEDTTEQILTLLNDRISNWITETPSSWVWFHNRWKKIKKT